MTDFRMGYIYSLAPIHCGGEGDLGNILEIAREVHTNFPYVPGSSLRGCLRDEVQLLNKIDVYTVMSTVVTYKYCYISIF